MIDTTPGSSRQLATNPAGLKLRGSRFAREAVGNGGEACPIILRPV